MVKVSTLQTVVQSGTQCYPILIGFMPATDILKIAGVPSFNNNTNHDTIATNVLTPPIREWQRPISMERVNVIASLFNNTGELMPNPVLLGENVAGVRPNIVVTPVHSPGGMPTGIIEVEFQQPGVGQEPALWVLDGQHRINGLARSAQSQNNVPVVFLLNANGNFYNGPLLAKLFAQVTTSAQKLDDLHNEWLTFAFKLGKYSSSNGQGAAHQNSMKCVAELCKQPAYGGITNPFFNQVKFNIHKNASPNPGGFSYTCEEFESLVFGQYFNQPAQQGHYSTTVVAEQIVLAHNALTQNVTNPNNSVFFGSAGHGQKIMQDAYLSGVLAYLRENGIPTSWSSVLQTLSFQSTNWNFNWVNSLNGRNQTISKNLATKLFVEAFRAKQLPGSGSGTIADILRGNNAEIELDFSMLSAANRPRQQGRISVPIQTGNRRGIQVSPAKHVRVGKKSINIGVLEITDMNSPPGRVVEYREIDGRGLILDPALHANPLSLLIQMTHYGGNVSSASIDISW